MCRTHVKRLEAPFSSVHQVRGTDPLTQACQGMMRVINIPREHDRAEFSERVGKSCEKERPVGIKGIINVDLLASIEV